jgi:pyrroloquinoline quinone biosynthesis protein D
MTAPAFASTTPRRRSGLHLEPSDGSNVLVSDEGTKILLLNETALALWELCDGETTFAEMVTVITDFFEAEPDVINTDVATALTQMVEAGVVSWT